MAIASFFHLGLVLLFLNVLDWGFTGVCIASSLQFVVRFIVAIAQVDYLVPGLKNVYGVKLFSKETTVQLSYQFNLGIMGMLMGVWGWWAFDIFTLMASYLSIEVVSA